MGVKKFSKVAGFEAYLYLATLLTNEPLHRYFLKICLVLRTLF